MVEAEGSSIAAGQSDFGTPSRVREFLCAARVLGVPGADTARFHVNRCRDAIAP